MQGARISERMFWREICIPQVIAMPSGNFSNMLAHAFHYILTAARDEKFPQWVEF